ncbi:response regulator transcription factor [Microlunatus spumicola]|uniref:Response regulator transcription factor n=1 Tax=Microlunatus spumicola TaxID=81499 RepID=A0ABP6WML2_9ACTN
MTALAAAPPVAPALRVLLSHDDRVFSGGVARLLGDAGLDVVAHHGDAGDLVGRVLADRPDVVVVDVRTPRSTGRDSLAAAVEVRRRSPGTAVLVLSHHYDAALAPQLIGDRPDGVGYLLQHRIGTVDHVLEAVAQVAAGGSVLDPEVVARLLGHRVHDDPLSGLSPAQLRVLAGMAEGASNRGIAESMHVSEAAVEKHVTALFRSLGLERSATQHRRVRAVLVYLRAVGRH